MTQAPGRPAPQLCTAATRAADVEGGSDRIFRSFACVIGLGGSVYGLIDSPEILHQSHSYDLWWTVLTFGSIFGTGLVLATVSFRASLATVRRVTSALAVGYLFCVALSPLAIDYGELTALSTWQYRIAALGAVCAGLAWPRCPRCVFGGRRCCCSAGQSLRTRRARGQCVVAGTSFVP